MVRVRYTFCEIQMQCSKGIDPIVLAFLNFWYDSNKIVDELSGKVAFHRKFQDKNPIVCKL